MKNILSTSILALAGMAFLVPTAKAAYADQTGFVKGDLVVAFSTSAAPPGHTGDTYLVDLGSISQFSTGGIFSTGAPVVVNAGSQSGYLADLSTAGIGSGGTFSVFGETSSGLTSKTAYISQPGGSPGLFNSNTIGIAVSEMSGLVSNANAAAAASTVNRSFIQDASQGNSYAAWNLGPQSPTSSWNTWSNAEGAFTQPIDLYTISNAGTAAATYLGSFEFDATTGALSFSSTGNFSAVPEPGTFAFGFALIGACAMGRFRRRQAAADLVA